jgi:hypothetical protein
VSVDPTDAFAVKPMPLQKRQNFIMFGGDSLGQLPKAAENTGPSVKTAASHFAQHERMHQNLVIQQSLLQTRLALAEMVYPYGGIHKKHVIDT